MPGRSWRRRRGSGTATTLSRRPSIARPPSRSWPGHWRHPRRVQLSPPRECIVYEPKTVNTTPTTTNRTHHHAGTNDPTKSSCQGKTCKVRICFGVGQPTPPEGNRYAVADATLGLLLLARRFRGFLLLGGPHMTNTFPIRGASLGRQNQEFPPQI